MDRPTADDDRQPPTAVADGGRLGWLNREVAAGVFLLAVAVAAFAATTGLRWVLPSGVGPGLMPRTSAAIVGGFGVLLVLQGLVVGGERLEAWSLRGLVFLLGAVAVFAATIRGFGLVVAGPAAIVTAALADADLRLKEIVPFALILTAACVVLFRFLLRQPIPLAPFWLGY